jgi:capsular polysaccharide export protein
MSLRLPVLRSPPFPGGAAEKAAVSEATVRSANPAPIPPGTTSALIEAIVEARVGSTFWAASPPSSLRPTLLLRPRSADDARDMAELAGRLATPAETLALLPDAPWAGAMRRRLEAGGVQALIGDVDPWPLLERASALLCAGDDEVALLALFRGLRVHCVSSGAVAGHGLTVDGPAVVAAQPMTLDELAHALLIAPVAYRDCFTGRSTDAAAAVERLAFWRGCIDANRDVVAGAGIAVWKRREIAAMLWGGSPHPLRFARGAAAAIQAARRAGGAIAVWPSRSPQGLAEAAAAAAVPLHSVEDGFVRSVGLGSALHPPLSVVLDRQGIHYDPTRPSDLETLLETAEMSPALVARAERLARTIVDAGITKYGSVRGNFTLDRGGKRVVLVTGQVEDDLSVRMGGNGIDNATLLARARAAEPDALILFKPHPDVDAGHRRGHVPDEEALRHADRIVRDVPMPALMEAVDAIHVLTSLAGFEALLRGREVVTHGSPFYAGWGLTRDLGPALPRRTRRLTLAELVAATLILYPRYLDPETGLPCPPETLIARLATQPKPRPNWLIRLRGLQGRLRRPGGWARSAA